MFYGTIFCILFVGVANCVELTNVNFAIAKGREKYGRKKIIISDRIFVLYDVRNTVKKVKVTLVQALRLCTGRTAHRGNRGIALLFHDQRH